MSKNNVQAAGASSRAGAHAPQPSSSSSRLIIRNLPPNTTQADLTSHFSSLPSTSASSTSSATRITDTKLLHKSDGTFRRFAFVGFKSAQDAERAKAYFDGTFMGTSKISVEFAMGPKQAGEANETASHRKRAPAGNEQQPANKRAKLSTPSSAKASGNGSTAPSASATAAAGGGEVTFDEFMAVMQPKSKRRTWANDDGTDVTRNGGAAIPSGNQQSDDEDVQDLTQMDSRDKKREKKEEKKKRKDKGKAAAHPANEETTKPEAEQEEAGNDEEGRDTEMTDAEYLASRMRRHVGQEFEEAQKQIEGGGSSSSASSADDSDAEQDGEPSSSSTSTSPHTKQTEDRQKRMERAEQRAAREREEAVKKEQEAVDIIMSTSRLLVRNLAFATTEEELKEWFEQWGEVRYVHIPVDKNTKVSKGLGFVAFANAPDALLAYRANDGTTFQGRLLHLLPAVDQHPDGLPATVSASTSKKSLKEQRGEERKRKAAEGKDVFNWSSFYMSADAVANSIAERMGISKNDIVNPGEEAGTSAAVRLALAETKVIQETKEFFKQNGVDLTTMEKGSADSSADEVSKMARNDCVMLVKNLPYGTTESEIRNLFARHGEVSSVLLPPAGTFAMVEMPIANEAREAFRALAYIRFKDKPIYLEKAPKGIFITNDEVERRAAAKQAPGSKLAAKLGREGEESEEQAGTAAAAATLFVKNLSFGTAEQGLAAAFQHLPDFTFARIKMKQSSAAKGKQPVKLSMGFGFVGFRTVEAAKHALEQMQGTALDGHVLSLKFAHQDASNMSGVTSSSALHNAAIDSKGSNTTLLVKNLPFEASKKEVRQLFEAHGQIKSVRVPRKLDRSARGFAFVEFVSRREASNAMEALKHTHLLGRHLVLKWAQEEDGAGGVGLERARGKARIAAVAAESAPDLGGSKRSKMKLGAQDIALASAQERKQREDAEEEDDEDLA